MQNLIQAYNRLLNQPDERRQRYLLSKIDFSNRLIGLIGARGSGKTTLLLHYLRTLPEPDKALYLSLDNIYFSSNSLLELVTEQYEREGRTLFVLDEAHKYATWAQEIKNIYDSFPDIRIIFSGSSSLDLVHGSHDLSRRGILYRLDPLSFREFIAFRREEDFESIDLESLVNQTGKHLRKLSNIPRLLGLFDDYLDHGYYPFFMESPDSYHQRLLQVIEKTIYTDIANHYNLKTQNLEIFRRILYYTASLTPGELNVNSISKHAGVDHKTISHYLEILCEVGLMQKISSPRAGSAILKKKEKIFLDNPNLYEAVSADSGHQARRGSIREVFFCRNMTAIRKRVFHAEAGDFQVGKYTFEVGGQSKTRRQIKGVENSYVVKANTLSGGSGEIPLWLFGFLY